MRLVSGILSLLISSTVFIGLFLFDFLFELLTFEVLIRDIVVFLVIYFIGNILLGYIEDIFENCRKIL